jgi:hypothetical protein
MLTFGSFPRTERPRGNEASRDVDVMSLQKQASRLQVAESLALFSPHPPRSAETRPRCALLPPQPPEDCQLSCSDFFPKAQIAFGFGGQQPPKRRRSLRVIACRSRSKRVAASGRRGLLQLRLAPPCESSRSAPSHKPRFTPCLSLLPGGRSAFHPDFARLIDSLSFGPVKPIRPVRHPFCQIGFFGTMFLQRAVFCPTKRFRGPGKPRLAADVPLKAGWFSPALQTKFPTKP